MLWPMLQNKVLFDHQAFTMQRNGGVSRYFVELFLHLPSLGVEVNRQIFIHRNKILSSQKNLENNFRFFDIENDRCVKYLNFINEKLSDIYIHRRDFDIFHPTYYKIPNRIPAKKPVVITVYDFIHEKFSKSVVRDKTITRKKDAILRADHIFCISENTKTDLLKLYDIDESTVSVTHLAASRFWLEGKRIKQLTEFRRCILYVGARDGYKNFLSLMKAFANSKILSRDFRILAFGGGSFTKQERDLQKQLGLPPECMIHVEGGDEVLRKLYQSVHLMVYPSHYEGFGLPILEAMHAGCAVICSNAGSIPEVGGGAVKYFDPCDTEELLAQLEAVAYDEGLIDELIELGSVQAQTFSWEKTAQQTITGYNRVT